MENIFFHKMRHFCVLHDNDSRFDLFMQNCDHLETA